MPSTITTAAEATLSRIQQDIMENSRREKELQEQYQHLYNTKHPAQEASDTEEEQQVTEPKPTPTNGFTKMSNGAAKSNWTPFLRAMSSSSLVPPPKQNGTTAVSYQRRFGTNGGVRGVMEKFIKSRGKMAQVQALPMNGFSTTAIHRQQSIPDVETTTRITVDPSKRRFVRNNFVPIEERMKREFQEMHSREKELHDHRRSLSTLNLNEIGKEDDESDNDSMYREPMGNGMKSARSMSELFQAANSNGFHRDREYESEDELERHSSNNLGKNTQMAKSLAELCDAPAEEIFTPGPQAVIMQFEKMIRKNHQHRA